MKRYPTPPHIYEIVEVNPTGPGPCGDVTEAVCQITCRLWLTSHSLQSLNSEQPEQLMIPNSCSNRARHQKPHVESDVVNGWSLLDWYLLSCRYGNHSKMGWLSCCCLSRTCCSSRNELSHAFEAHQNASIKNVKIIITWGLPVLIWFISPLPP